MTVYTIGHSTRTLELLVEMLAAQHVTVLADVRTVPRSRHNPQFNQDTLPEALGAAGIRYVALPRLGGLRHGLKTGSPNTGWRNKSFRGYADYMLTDGFEEGLRELLSIARTEPTAIMCAEAVPYRCHRSLIADALTARGVEVREISSKTRAAPHRMTPFARVEGERVTYPPLPEVAGGALDQAGGCAVMASVAVPGPDACSEKNGGRAMVSVRQQSTTGRSRTASVDGEKAAAISLKRAYDEPGVADGHRVLVDRLWPRGVRKDALAIDAWMKEIGPSDELRRWFGHDPARWEEFVKRYRHELRRQPAAGLVAELVAEAKRGPLTLVYGAKDEVHNQAIVIRDLIKRRVRRARASAPIDRS